MKKIDKSMQSIHRKMERYAQVIAHLNNLKKLEDDSWFNTILEEEKKLYQQGKTLDDSLFLNEFVKYTESLKKDIETADKGKAEALQDRLDYLTKDSAIGYLKFKALYDEENIIKLNLGKGAEQDYNRLNNSKSSSFIFADYLDKLNIEKLDKESVVKVLEDLSLQTKKGRDEIESEHDYDNLFYKYCDEYQLNRESDIVLEQFLYEKHPEVYEDKIIEPENRVNDFLDYLEKKMGNNNNEALLNLLENGLYEEDMSRASDYLIHGMTEQSIEDAFKDVSEKDSNMPLFAKMVAEERKNYFKDKGIELIDRANINDITTEVDGEEVVLNLNTITASLFKRDQEFNKIDENVQKIIKHFHTKYGETAGQNIENFIEDDSIGYIEKLTGMSDTLQEIDNNSLNNKQFQKADYIDIQRDIAIASVYRKEIKNDTQGMSQLSKLVSEIDIKVIKDKKREELNKALEELKKELENLNNEIHKQETELKLEMSKELKNEVYKLNIEKNHLTKKQEELQKELSEVDNIKIEEEKFESNHLQIVETLRKNLSDNATTPEFREEILELLQKGDEESIHKIYTLIEKKERTLKNREHLTEKLFQGYGNKKGITQVMEDNKLTLPPELKDFVNNNDTINVKKIEEQYKEMFSKNFNKKIQEFSLTQNLNQFKSQQLSFMDYVLPGKFFSLGGDLLNLAGVGAYAGYLKIKQLKEQNEQLKIVNKNIQGLLNLNKMDQDKHNSVINSYTDLIDMGVDPKDVDNIKKDLKTSLKYIGDMDELSDKELLDYRENIHLLLYNDHPFGSVNELQANYEHKLFILKGVKDEQEREKIINELKEDKKEIDKIIAIKVKILKSLEKEIESINKPSKEVSDIENKINIIKLNIKNDTKEITSYKPLDINASDAEYQENQRREELFKKKIKYYNEQIKEEEIKLIKAKETESKNRSKTKMGASAIALSSILEDERVKFINNNSVESPSIKVSEPELLNDNPTISSSPEEIEEDNNINM